MLPIELTHYTVWAERLEAALDAAYPRTLWVVPDAVEVLGLPITHDAARYFCVVAMTQDGSRQVTAQVPFPLVVDEEAFPLVVVALGREIERRLAATVKE